MIVGVNEIACIFMGCGMYVPTPLITHVCSIYFYVQVKVVVVLLEYFSLLLIGVPLQL